MTNSEAIKQLKGIRSDYDIDMKRYPELVINDVTALDVAIEALSNSQNQTDSELKTTTGAVSEADVIYRQDAIDAAIKADMENHNGILSEKRARVFEEHIAILPPAQRTGEWMLSKNEMFVQCSECGCHWESGLVKNCNMVYCPNCGVEMREKKQSNEERCIYKKDLDGKTICYIDGYELSEGYCDICDRKVVDGN